MTTTHLAAVAIGLASMCVTGLNAQTQETQTKTNTKIEIKDGKDVTAIGCVERRSDRDYVLTDVRDKNRLEHARYALVTNQDLTKYVGQRVEVKGKAATNDNGTVSIESKTKTDVTDGKDQEAKTKTEGTIGPFDLPYLGVRSMKTLSRSCP